MKQLKKFKLVAEPTGQYCPAVSVKSSQDLHNVFRMIHKIEGNDFQEHFYAVFLNRANHVTGYYFASMGGITGTIADPRLIIKSAVLADCCGLALCHNHPSGQVNPSQQDKAITDKINCAAAYLDIKILDHIILGEDEYFSFADDGLI